MKILGLWSYLAPPRQISPPNKDPGYAPGQCHSNTFFDGPLSKSSKPPWATLVMKYTGFVCYNLSRHKKNLASRSIFFKLIPLNPKIRFFTPRASKLVRGKTEGEDIAPFYSAKECEYFNGKLPFHRFLKKELLNFNLKCCFPFWILFKFKIPPRAEIWVALA